MRVAALLPGWSGRRPALSPGELDDEIRAELAFHLAELEAEFGRQGHAAEEAQALARERFGDPEEYFSHCRRIKMHDRLVLQRVLVGCVAVLVVTTGGLLWQVVSLARSQQHAAALLATMRQEVQALRDAPITPAAAGELPQTPITGVVTAKGRPLAGAHVLAVIKSWPDGVYRQDPVSAVTDADGRFALPEGLPNAAYGHRALHIAVVADGYAFESQYFDKSAVLKKGLGAIAFELEEVPEYKTRLVRPDGSPLAGATVVPSERRTLAGEMHLLYFDASAPVARQSDSDGYVALAGYAPQDLASLNVRTLPKGDWLDVEMPVELADGTFEVVVPE